MVLKALFANARILVLSIYVVNEFTPRKHQRSMLESAKKEENG